MSLMLAISNSKMLAIVPPWPLRTIAAAKNHEHRIDLDLKSQRVLGLFEANFLSMKTNHSSITLLSQPQLHCWQGFGGLGRSPTWGGWAATLLMHQRAGLPGVKRQETSNVGGRDGFLHCIIILLSLLILHRDVTSTDFLSNVKAPGLPQSLRTLKQCQFEIR